MQKMMITIPEANKDWFCKNSEY